MVYTISPFIKSVPSGFQTFHFPVAYVTVFVRVLATPASVVRVRGTVIQLPAFTLYSVALPTIFILILISSLYVIIGVTRTYSL